VNKPIAPLDEALLKEIDRVRDVVLPDYVDMIAAAGAGVHRVHRALDAAAKAMIEGDVVAMFQSLKTLKGITG